MTDVLLAGLLADVAREGFANARGVDVKIGGWQIDEDQWGMPIFAKRDGAVSDGVVVCDLSDEDATRIAKIAYSYDLRALEIEIGIEGDLRSFMALSSQGLIAPRAPKAKEVLQAVLDAKEQGLGRAVVLGAGYRLASLELAQNEHRELKYTHQGQREDFIALEVEPLDIGFYAHERFKYRHKKFSGEASNFIARDVLVSGDAAIVLPYDPKRDAVVLIEQLRPAALARGAFDAWGLEAVAGLISQGEAPELTAKRELEEEAGLKALGLYPLAPSYQSPGTVSQMMYPFIAAVDLSNYEAGYFGLASENEDIRSHILSREEAVALLKTGEAGNAPLQILLYALALDHQEISKALLAKRDKHE